MRQWSFAPIEPRLPIPTLAIWRGNGTQSGIVYPSIKEAAQAIGIEESSVRHHIKRGFTCDTDLHRSENLLSGTIPVIQRLQQLRKRLSSTDRL